MDIVQYLDVKGVLTAKLIRKDGTVEDLGNLAFRKPWWRRLWHWIHFDERGIVTTAGVNYMATDFASGGVSPRISAFNFHDSGTGIVAPAVGDTGLGTPTGEARNSGTQSNPTANQYRSIATHTYAGTFAITEWGIFSASTAGTLWDRRTFTAINVVSGDSIQFTYTLTVNNGGT